MEYVECFMRVTGRGQGKRDHSALEKVEIYSVEATQQ